MAERYDTPEPFKVDIPERALIDLDERLRRMEESALSKDDDLKREIEKLERDDGKA